MGNKGTNIWGDSPHALLFQGIAPTCLPKGHGEKRQHFLQTASFPTLVVWQQVKWSQDIPVFGLDRDLPVKSPKGYGG